MLMLNHITCLYHNKSQYCIFGIINTTRTKKQYKDFIYIKCYINKLRVVSKYDISDRQGLKSQKFKNWQLDMGMNRVLQVGK